MTFEVAICSLFIAYAVTMFLIVWRDNRELKESEKRIDEIMKSIKK